MNKLKKLDSYSLIAVFYPVCLIIDAFILPSTEFGKLFISEELTIRRLNFPFFQILLTLLTLFFVKISFKSSIYFFYLFFVIFLSIFFFSPSILLKVNFISGLIIVYFLITSPNYLTTFKCFVFSYTSLSILIIFYRFFFLNVTLIKLRGDINIWGGLDLIAVWIAYYLVSSFNGNKNANNILLFTFFLSVIYISRTGILITLVMLFLNLSKIKISQFISIFIFCIIIYFLFFEYFELIFTRFDILDSNSLSASRGFIWSEAFGIFNQNIHGIGLGNYILKSSTGFSNPHNFFLDIFVNFGFVVGSVISILVIKPLVNLLLFKKYKLAINYILYSVLLVVGGVTFIQVGGSVSYHTFLCFYVLNQTFK